MNSIFSTMNAAESGERPAGAAERPFMSAAPPTGRFFRRMALWVILGFWLTYFTTLTAARLAVVATENWLSIVPRGIMSLLAILLSFGILAVLRRARGRGLVWRALTAACLALAGCMVHTALNTIVFFQFVPGTSPWYVIVAEYPISLLTFIWQYLAISVMLLALTYGEDVVDREERIVALQAQANVAQLNALRYQLNPHFLFNTLNSVASLIARNGRGRSRGDGRQPVRFPALDAADGHEQGDHARRGDQAPVALSRDREGSRFPNRLQRRDRCAREARERARAQSRSPSR